jgi:hypothetical protein
VEEAAAQPLAFIVQANPHERVTLQGTNVHRFSEAHLLIASAPAVFLIASALGVVSMGSTSRCVDVSRVEHAAPPHDGPLLY